MELVITTQPTPELYTIVVEGEVDISNASKLRDAIDLALEQPTDTVQLDFAQVAYIDSTGIGVLVGAAHHAEERGKRFSVAHVQPAVMRVMQLILSRVRIGCRLICFQLNEREAEIIADGVMQIGDDTISMPLPL